jgi:diacylglycerol kinase (ATP)
MPTNAKNIAIVCNQLAGSGLSVVLAEKIVENLFSKNILHILFKENWPPDFNGFTDVWIVGGDGTLNYFVNHYPNIQLPLVIFNGGTGNDFHWMLYGTRNFQEQLQQALIAEPKPIDLGKCNEKYFINGVGVGFEGEVAKRLAGKKKKAGKASFMAMILKKIFSYRSRIYRVVADDKTIAEKKYFIIDISNGSRAGGGFHIAPQAKADDGLFDLVTIDALHPLIRLRWLPVIEKGKHLNLSFVTHLKVRQISIESNESILFHLDGEYYEAAKLDVDIMAGKLLFRY